jgi:hypothetical protein
MSKYYKSLCDELGICVQSGVLVNETSAKTPNRTAHTLFQQRKSRALADELWMCGTYLAHSQ